MGITAIPPFCHPNRPHRSKWGSAKDGLSHVTGYSGVFPKSGALTLQPLRCCFAPPSMRNLRGQFSAITILVSDSLFPLQPPRPPHPDKTPRPTPESLKMSNSVRFGSVSVHFLVPFHFELARKTKSFNSSCSKLLDILEGVLLVTVPSRRQWLLV